MRWQVQASGDGVSGETPSTMTRLDKPSGSWISGLLGAAGVVNYLLDLVLCGIRKPPPLLLLLFGCWVGLMIEICGNLKTIYVLCTRLGLLRAREREKNEGECKKRW